MSTQIEHFKARQYERRKQLATRFLNSIGEALYDEGWLSPEYSLDKLNHPTLMTNGRIQVSYPLSANTGTIELTTSPARIRESNAIPLIVTINGETLPEFAPAQRFKITEANKARDLIGRNMYSPLEEAR